MWLIREDLAQKKQEKLPYARNFAVSYAVTLWNPFEPLHKQAWFA